MVTTAGPADSGTTVSVDAAAERLLGSILGSVEAMSVYLGDRLGWYASLATDGPASAPQLAERTGTDPRYTREWLEQQAVAGYLEVAADGAADERVFAIDAAHAEVLTDTSSLSYMAPLARMFGAVGPTLPHLLDAYRHGGGITWDEFGPDAREGQADANRPWYEQRLAAALAGVPEVHDRLSAPGARVLDVGSGGGWSTIALARAYPSAVLQGVDIDEPSVEMARAHAAESGVGDRVTFTSGDAAALDTTAYDVAFAFECVHDMPRPADVLGAVRRALKPGGVMVVMDEAVADEFAPHGDELERVMYGFSLFVCLPDSMSSPPSVATGTVMRPSALRGYALDAGFASMDVLPIENFGFWRFYLLR